LISHLLDSALAACNNVDVLPEVPVCVFTGPIWDISLDDLSSISKKFDKLITIPTGWGEEIYFEVVYEDSPVP
jgi:hypothetical protein